MKNYPKYKDSGVEWLGEIPSEWDDYKVKFAVKVNKDALSESTAPEFEFSYIDIESVNGSSIEKTRKMVFENAPSRARRIVKNGDVILSTVRTYLKAIAQVNGIEGEIVASTGFAVFSASKIIMSNYLKYLAVNDHFIQSIECRSKGTSYPAIAPSELITIKVPIPPLSEQHSIVQFLDHKTNRIDRFIANRQKQIELLKEQKAGIINKAVTKGIGSLSVSTERSRSGVETPNTKMKDSGIEWIGEVPEHWEIVKLKFLTKKISKGTTPSTEGREILETGEIRFLKAENITPDGISLFPEFFIDDETNQILKRSQLQEHDILFVIAGATIGKAAIITDVFIPANTNQAVCFIRLKKNVLPELVLNQLQACYIKNKMAVESVVAAQPNISMENIGNFQIFLPPIDEQSHLMKFIKEEVTNIDTLISKYQNQIDLMQEYRTALISQAVTGKIDVRDWKPKAKKHKTEAMPVGMAAEKTEDYE